MKPPIIRMKLWKNTQTRPAAQPLIGIAGLERDRQHDHEGDDEHVRHADARRQRADVGAAGLLRQPIGEPGVVERREAHHQAERRQDAAEHERVRHLQHEAQQPGQHQHVDQDVGAEAEEGVPVARRPQCRFEVDVAAVRRARAHRDAPAAAVVEVSGESASSTAAESETQPKMPPWALIIFRPISWNSGKVGCAAVGQHDAAIAAVVGLAHGGVDADFGGDAARPADSRCRGSAASSSRSVA